MFQEPWPANKAIFLCGDGYSLSGVFCYHDWPLLVLHGFTVDDLVFLVSRSEEQLWDCLRGPQVPNPDGRIILPRECELTAEEQDFLSDFVTRLRIFARDRNVFHSGYGRIGAGPSGNWKGRHGARCSRMFFAGVAAGGGG
jgi:hypothetical protein